MKKIRKMALPISPKPQRDKVHIDTISEARDELSNLGTPGAGMSHSVTAVMKEFQSYANKLGGTYDENLDTTI